MAEGDIGVVISSFIFDAVRGITPSIIHISENVVAIAYRGPDDDGWLQTVRVASDGATISTIASLEFDVLYGNAPKIIHVYGNVYAIAYMGETNHGWLKTVTISDDGATIALTGSSLEFAPNLPANNPWVNVIHVAGTTYAIAFVRNGAADRGEIHTVSIQNDGTIGGAVLASLVFDTKGQYPDIIHISGSVFAVAYSGPDNDGWLKTVTISDDGTSIILTGASLEFDNVAGTSPRILHRNGLVYLVVYTGGEFVNGRMKSLSISNDGLTLSAVGSFAFDSSDGNWPWLFNTSRAVYAIPYNGIGDDGWIKTYSVSDDGVTCTLIDSLEFDLVDSIYAQMVRVSGDIYAIAYTFTGNVGKLVTLDIKTVLTGKGYAYSRRGIL